MKMMKKTGNCEQFSESYIRIKAQAETEWPLWKIDAYNNYASPKVHKLKPKRK
jgi:hypothetical protein